jgi:UDP-arabinose 4-epimerase
MTRSSRTVLVTGGAGYVGSHACKALHKADYLPVVYDNFCYGHDWAVKWGPLERGDILDRTRLDEVIAKYRPDAVMHFAAFAYVGESMADPYKYYNNNVVGSLRLLEAVRDHGVNKFIFSSTCATYGAPDELPIHEDTPQRPINPYGASKLMVERILADFGSAHRLSSICLRYFNAAGADPDNDIGEVHDPETHLIPLVLEAASGRRPYVTVFGADYDTPDGTCLRDYIHVTDLAEAHVRALDALRDCCIFGAYNLGNGQSFSVRQIVEAVEHITGLRVPVRIGTRRNGDPPALVSNAARARTALNWQPRFSDLDEIVRTAWAWHQKANGKAAKGSRQSGQHDSRGR